MSTKRLILFHIEIRNRHLQLDAIKYLIQLLPIVNRNTLYALLKFLSNMAQFSEDSKNASGKHCFHLLLKLFIIRPNRLQTKKSLLNISVFNVINELFVQESISGNKDLSLV